MVSVVRCDRCGSDIIPPEDALKIVTWKKGWLAAAKNEKRLLPLSLQQQLQPHVNLCVGCENDFIAFMSTTPRNQAVVNRRRNASGR
jgi:hypothetical protein